MATEEEESSGVAVAMEAVGLSQDAGHDLQLDQSTFFRCVKDANLQSLKALLNNRRLDVNAYNDDGSTALQLDHGILVGGSSQMLLHTTASERIYGEERRDLVECQLQGMLEGVTPLHLAVYDYERSRNLGIVEILIRHGANVFLKAAVTQATHKVSFVRHDSNNPHSDAVLTTKKVDFDKKTPLLIALELKSSLYLKGWEYRHWDAMLLLLSDASLKQYTAKGVRATTGANEVFEIVQKGWENVFCSEKHELVEIWSEAKHLVALKVLLTNSSKILKLKIDNAAVLHSNRIELKDASFNIVKAMVGFLYTGKVESQLMTQRGIDLFLAAHKYGVELLKRLCESEVVATQDNWIKLLTAATECDSEILGLKCVESIKKTMESRDEISRMLKKSFSESIDAPGQLFDGPMK